MNDDKSKTYLIKVKLTVIFRTQTLTFDKVAPSYLMNIRNLQFSFRLLLVGMVTKAVVVVFVDVMGGGRVVMVRSVDMHAVGSGMRIVGICGMYIVASGNWGQDVWR